MVYITNYGKKTIMKILHGSPGFGSMMSETQLIDFLTISKLNLHLGTIDDKGEPNIHPVWYYFENERLFVLTGKDAKKAQNISKNNSVYFCIDDDEEPPKGVRGKASAVLMEDISKLVSIAEKMAIKYTGNLDNKIAKLLVEMVKKYPSVLIELKPKYYSTWDHQGSN